VTSPPARPRAGAEALSDAVNELIANGDYTKIFAKWGVAGTDEITKSTLNPTPTF